MSVRVVVVRTSCSARGSCWYDAGSAERGEVRTCTSGHHRFRFTGQRWVLEPPE